MSVLAPLDRRRRGAGDGGGAGAPIDPRIEARRQAVHGERRHRLRRRLLTLAVVLTVVAALFGVTRTAALDVDTIDVVGAQQSDPAAVRQASGIAVGDPLVGLDLARAESGVRALPWVKDVAVIRGWDGTVTLNLTERSPVAALQVSAGPDSWVLVDADRHVLAPLATHPTELPVIDGVASAAPGQQLGPAAATPIAVAQALTPGLRSRVASVHVVDATTVDLAVKPAGVVHLGTTEQLPQKVQSLQTVFGQVDLHCLATVDLRVPDAPVLTRDRACV